jgi:hypothetical protein
MTLLDHAVLQVDDLNAVGDWYDQIVSLAGGRRTFATALGAELLHEPRLWSEYGPDYHAVFIRDPAGNNLELKCGASNGTVTPGTPNRGRRRRLVVAGHTRTTEGDIDA